MAWRASLRARSLPVSRWSQRPSALLPKQAERCPGPARYASESAPAAGAAAETVKNAPKEIPKRAGRGSRKLRYGTSLVVVLLIGYVYGTDTRASIHRYGIVPLIRQVWPDAEDAHHKGVELLKQLYRFGLHPRERNDPDRDGALATEVLLAIAVLPQTIWSKANAPRY